MPPMDQGPPLAVSPSRNRHRPRRNLGAAVPSTPVRSSLPCPERRPIISPELIKMANINVKEVHSEETTAVENYSPSFSCTSPVFERGRLYELYSARRNERLERRKGQMTTTTMMMDDDENADVGNDPRVAEELSQRRCNNAKKASENYVRKSVPANFSLRSSKEMKRKASVTASCQKPTDAAAAAAAAAGKRFPTRSVRRT